MSKPRFSLYAEIDTLNHANTIKNNITNELVGKDIFEQHAFSVYAEDGKNLIIGEWRFNNQIDRDAIRDWAQDQIQNHPQIKVWTQKAKVTWHRCTHDENPFEDCKTTNYGEWNK